MSLPSQDLRRLAERIEALTRESRVASMAWDQVRALCDTLILRARVMELEAAQEELLALREPIDPGE